MKTRRCDECRHYDDIRCDTYPIGKFVCTKGHAPRFYVPRNPLDGGYGYKRKCEDFEPKDQK